MPPTFKKFNDDASQCCAWIKGEDRCCRRRIAVADLKRKSSLLGSATDHQAIPREDSEELANLYFCKGWHRVGGAYAISTAERQKVLLLLFPNASEPATRSTPSLPPRPAPLPPTLTQGSELPDPQQVPSDTQDSVDHTSDRNPRLANTANPRDISQNVAPGLVLSSDIIFQPGTSRQSRQTTHVREELETPRRPALRQSACLQGQPPNNTAQQSTLESPDDSRTTPTQTSSASPQATSVSLTQDRRGSQRDSQRSRRVDLTADCPICSEAFVDASSLVRCNSCQNDVHEDCLLGWLVTPGGSPSCIWCRASIRRDEIKWRIEAIADPERRTILKELYELKQNLGEQLMD